jgi:hypothetical protein
MLQGDATAGAGLRSLWRRSSAWMTGNEQISETTRQRTLSVPPRLVSQITPAMNRSVKPGKAIKKWAFLDSFQLRNVSFADLILTVAIYYRGARMQKFSVLATDSILSFLQISTHASAATVA